MMRAMDFTPGELFAGIVVSALGTGIFLYGKTQRRAPQLVAGVLLMACPLVGGGPWTITGVGAALGAGLWLALRFGM